MRAHLPHNENAVFAMCTRTKLSHVYECVSIACFSSGVKADARNLFSTGSAREEGVRRGVYCVLQYQ